MCISKPKKRFTFQFFFTVATMSQRPKGDLLFFVLYLLVLLAATFPAAQGKKVYDRCELAHELRDLHELPKDQIGTWVCIARYESDYNTSAINKESGDHGLFQISELFWCSPPGAACGISCASLRDDDIEDDVVCARRIYRQHQRLHGNGFLAWIVYNQHCKNAEGFVDDCWTKDDNSLKKKDDKDEKKEHQNVGDITVDVEDEVVKTDADECNYEHSDAKSLNKECKKKSKPAVAVAAVNKGRAFKLPDNYEYASTPNGFKLVLKKST